MPGEINFGRRDFLKTAVAGVSAFAVEGGLSSGAPLPAKVRYGVVGSGNRSRSSHLPILRGLFPNVEITALCDITPENLQAGLQVCGSDTAGYSDYRQMIEKHPELDAVLVIVPSYVHAEIAVAALEAGKHVLTEKPLATHLADGNRMIETAAKRKKTLQVGSQMRYSLLFHRMAELIRQGAIGQVELVLGALCRGDWNPKSWQYTDPVTGKSMNWRYLTLTEGSALLEDGIHELDVIHWLVGAEPQRIQAQGGNNVYVERQTIDNAGILIEFTNGVRCNFLFSIFTPGAADHSALRLYGTQAEMTVAKEDEKQFVVINHYRGKTDRIEVPYLLPDEESRWRAAFPQKMDARGDVNTYREHEAFYHSVTTGAPPFADGKAGLDAAHISLAAERSLRTGRPLSWDDQEEAL
ncbi:MAG: Gfo/Idh/MocA family protein [Terriglobia bacterium]